MLLLTINHKPVTLKDGTSFKLTRENPAITDGGDYTFDITLPLRGCRENMEVFGAVYRPDMHVTTPTLRGRMQTAVFDLVADGLRLSGTAIITSVTQDDIKLQLIAGKSETALRTKNSKGEDLYIDELDLGLAWADFHASSIYAEQEQTLETSAMMTYNHPSRVSMCFGNADVTDCVALPIHSDADDLTANDWELSVFDDNNEGTRGIYWTRPLAQQRQSVKPYDSGTIAFRKDFVLAPQPYLVTVLEKVLNTIGCPLSPSNNAIRTTWIGDDCLADIFIANSRNTIRIASMLPHWTVEEFLKEVENFFCCVIEFDGTSARVRMRAAASSAQADNITLEDVTDEHTTDLDEDEQVENYSASGNVAFDYPDADNYSLLPEEVWDHATVTTWEHFQQMTEDEKKRALVVKDNHLCAYLPDENDDWELEPVDFCAGLYRDSSTRETQLNMRIVPVRGETWNDQKNVRHFLYDGYTPGFAFKGNYELLAQPKMATGDTTTATGGEEYTIHDYLSGATESSDKRDVMEVAYRMPRKYGMSVYDGDSFLFETSQYTDVDGCPGWSGHETGSTSINLGQYGRFFISNQPEGVGKADRMMRQLLDGQAVVLSKEQRSFSFLDDFDYDPTRVFIIHGQRYVCEKIELTIDNQGVQKLKKGTFYPLRDE